MGRNEALTDVDLLLRGIWQATRGTNSLETTGARCAVESETRLDCDAEGRIAAGQVEQAMIAELKRRFVSGQNLCLRCL